LLPLKTGLQLTKQSLLTHPFQRWKIFYAGPRQTPQLRGKRQARRHLMSDPGLSKRGRVSNWWKGRGEGSVHSSVVAPTPNQFGAALSLRAKASAILTRAYLKIA
jgi:hypothetical protein